MSISPSGQVQDTLLQLKKVSKEKTTLTQQLELKGEEVKHLERAMSGLRAELLGKESELVQVREAMESLKKTNQVCMRER